MSRVRRRIGIAFVAVLAATSLYFSGRTRSQERSYARSAPTVVSSAAANTERLRAVVSGSESCSDAVATIPTIRCAFDRADVEYRLVGATAVADTYRAGAGAIPDGDRRGPAQCAAGHDEERAWSRVATPRIEAGRYRCAVVAGRAEMWWTDEDHGLVAHARAFDGDLVQLFAWWLTAAEG